MDNRLLVVFLLAVTGLAFLAWSLPVDSAMIVGGAFALLTALLWGVVATRRGQRAQANITTIIRAYQHVIDKAGTPVFIMDVDGKITFWNEAAVTMSGVAADQAIGRPLTDTMRSGMTSEQVHAFLARALSGEKVNDVEARIESSAGKHYEVLTSAIALHGVGGQPDQVVCISQDRTSFMESQRQLTQASKMATLGEMAAGMAHELNQPLNVIRMSLQNAQRQLERDDINVERLADKLSRIDQQVSRSARLIDHLRLFGRKASETKESFLLAPIIEQVRDMYADQLALANIKLVVNCDLKDARVEGEPTLFEQVFLNCIANSRDAIKELFNGEVGGTISLCGHLEDDNHCLLTLQDNGGGASLGVLENIFDPFYTTKEPGKGTGLGLSVSYGTIRDMNGSIEATNNAGGLMMAIRLPLL